MKDVLSVVATNLHIVVISLLIVGLDLGVVHVGDSRTHAEHPPTSITLSTSSDDGQSSSTQHHTPTAPAISAILPGGKPAEPWKPPAERWVKGL